MVSAPLVQHARLHWKYFRKYFLDAAFFVYEAYKLNKQAPNDLIQQARLANAGIIYCALALEAAANCCIDSLQLPRRTYEDIEKLQILTKFDYFVNNIKPRTHLNPEDILIRPIRNIVSIRNIYVHSKVEIENVINDEIDLNIWQPIGLPHNPDYWQPIHAVKTFTVITDFLNYFFFKLCGFPYEGDAGRQVVLTVLNSTLSGIDGQKLPGDVLRSVIHDNFPIPVHIATEWDLEFAFLGIKTTGINNIQIYPKRKWGDYSHCDVSTVSFPHKWVAYPIPGGIGIIRTKPKSKNSQGGAAQHNISPSPPLV